MQGGAPAAGICKAHAKQRVLQRERGPEGRRTGDCWTLSQDCRRCNSTGRAESGQVGLHHAKSTYGAGRLSSNQSTMESLMGYPRRWERQCRDGRKYPCHAHTDTKGTQNQAEDHSDDLAQAVSPLTGHKGRGTAQRWVGRSHL